MSKSWEIYFFKIFYERIKQLAKEVKELKEKDPQGYKNHKKAKILAKIWAVIYQRIAINPLDKDFHLGDTLPKKYRYYKRVKAGLPSRYRLFFRFKNEDEKIVIVWLNDEFSLRKKGSRTDVYTVFISMIKNDKVPENWKKLLIKSKTLSKIVL